MKLKIKTTTKIIFKNKNHYTELNAIFQNCSQTEDKKLKLQSKLYSKMKKTLHRTQCNISTVHIIIIMIPVFQPSHDNLWNFVQCTVILN